MPPAKRPASKRSPTRARPKRAAPPVDALAFAAWAEADAALAEALVECARAIEAPTQAARADSLELLSLALSRAARRRGLSRIGRAGALEDFDPKRHDLASAPKRAPKRVRIVSEGIVRGRDVLIKAQAVPARAKRHE